MWSILGFGAFGGVSPTLMKFAASLVTFPGNPMPEFAFYIGVGIYAVLGSVIAIAMGEQTLRGALFAGIAAPALITNAITGTQDVRLQSGGQRTSELSFVSRASAQEMSSKSRGQIWHITPELQEQIKAAQQQKPESDRTVSFILINDQLKELPVKVCFFMKGEGQDEKKCDQAQTVATAWGKPTTLMVPKDSTGVSVGGEMFPLHKARTFLGVNAQFKPTSAGDFLWALGGKRELELTGVGAAELEKQ